jgi:hypothetical protein
VFNRLQHLPFLGLSGGVLFLLSACTSLPQARLQLNVSPHQFFSRSGGNSPQFELKPVNDQGGQFCTNGETAFGPISDKMIQKCQDWGGGNSCTQNQWTESLFINAYGSGRCPAGSRLNASTGYCIESLESSNE